MRQEVGSNGKRRVTVKEISKIVGVSAATVTNALTGQPNVSDKMRKKIIETARELGYTPNHIARAMVKNGITIGIIVTGEPKEYVQYMLKGIYEAAAELKDYKVTVKEYIYKNNRATTEVLECINRMMADNVDGLFFGAGFDSSCYIETLKKYINERNLPVVYLGYNSDELPCTVNIRTDSAITGGMAAQLLGLVLGKCAEIAVITTSTEYPAHKAIVNQFIKEADLYGLKITEIAENRDSKELTYKHTRELIDRHPDLKAIYITSFDSVSVCRCIEDMNAADRISVISHDIYREMLGYLENGPLIATIYQNPQRIGKEGIMQTFYSIVGREGLESSIVVRPELVMRSSLSGFTGEL